MEDTVKFKTTIQDIGNSQGVILPKQLTEYLKINKGDQIEMSAYNKKKGKYIAIWKKNEQ